MKLSDLLKTVGIRPGTMPKAIRNTGRGWRSVGHTAGSKMPKSPMKPKIKIGK